MNRSAREAKRVKRFERSNGLDTALYKNYLYLFTDSGGRFLGNGITVAVFHNFGSTPSRRELLNIDVTGPASCCAKSLTINGGILSGPVDLFILTFASAASLTMTINDIYVEQHLL